MLDTLTLILWQKICKIIKKINYWTRIHDRWKQPTSSQVQVTQPGIEQVILWSMYLPTMLEHTCTLFAQNKVKLLCE